MDESNKQKQSSVGKPFDGGDLKKLKEEDNALPSLPLGGD